MFILVEKCKLRNESFFIIIFDKQDHVSGSFIWLTENIFSDTFEHCPINIQSLYHLQ